MKKIIFEEIDRIKEIMGLKLISESAPIRRIFETLISDFIESSRPGIDYASASLGRLATEYQTNLGEMAKMRDTTPNFGAMLDALDAVDPDPSKQAMFLASLKNGIALHSDTRNFVNALMTTTWTNDFGMNSARQYLKELNEYAYSFVDDVNYQNAFRDFNSGDRSVITDNDFGDITYSFNQLRNNFEEGTPLWDEVSDMYKKLTGRELDNPDVVVTRVSDDVVDDVSDDVANVSDEEIETKFITAEESVKSQAVKSGILDESGNLKSKAAAQKKKFEVVEDLSQKPQSKWTEEDYAWVALLNDLKLLSEQENRRMYNQLPAARELIELREQYIQYKSISKSRKTTPKTFQRWLEEKGYKYPGWMARGWSRIVEGFDNFGKHYGIVTSGKFDMQWWKSLGIIMLHVGLIIGGTIGAFWQFTKRAGEKASSFLDNLIDLTPEEIQTALNEFFDYDSPKIDGIDVYSSDDSGAFNAENYKKQAPSLDEVINSNENTISLKTYVMVNGKYCRAFKISVSQAPLSGAENFLPHEMSTSNFKCVETPEPKYMPGGSANTGGGTGGGTTTTTTTTAPNFEEWIGKKTAQGGGGGYQSGDYEVVSGSGASGEITVKIDGEPYTAKLVNNNWEWQ